MTFGTDIQNGQRVTHNNSGDALTFHLAPPAGQTYILNDISIYLVVVVVVVIMDTISLLVSIIDVENPRTHGSTKV